MIVVEIKKPLYGNFVYINESQLNKAISLGEKIEVVVPKGRAIIDPVEWKKNGKRMEKVFLFPDKPMILWGGNVPLPPSKDEPKPKKERKKKERVKVSPRVQELIKLFRPVFGNDLHLQIVQQYEKVEKLYQMPSRAKDLKLHEANLIASLEKALGLSPVSTDNSQ